MSSQVLFSGDAALEDVVSFVQDTPPEALIVCAQSAEELSRITVHLVRRLRGSQGRIEFHQPASPEAMLQAVNRLMQDVPIDELTSTRPGDGDRMVIVERAASAMRASDAKEVGFYKSWGRYGALSNFSPHSIVAPKSWRGGTPIEISASTQA